MDQEYDREKSYFACPVGFHFHLRNFLLRAWIQDADLFLCGSSSASPLLLRISSASRQICSFQIGQRHGFENFHLGFPNSEENPFRVKILYDLSLIRDDCPLKKKRPDSCNKKMTMSASHFHSTLSKTRGRSSGWAAFDLKQRQKRGLEHKVEVDPYPPMPSSSIDTTRNLVATNFLSRGSFASVVQPSANFPVLVNNCRSGNLADNSCTKLQNQVAEESDIAITHEKLKKLHSWADDSLVDDILAAVSNDVDQASAVLGAMDSSGSNDLKKDLPGTLSVLEDHVHDHIIEQGGECVKLEDQPSSSAPVKLIPEHLFAVPIEPEWQEDDVYLLHRKEAIRVMRSASRHSQAANNAFQRGNHFAAQQLSLKARDEWLAAEKLNARAADEILRIRNARNDAWKLDLHGLHASEAVRVLEEHLQKIETQMPMSNSISSYSLTKPEIQTVHSPSVEPPSCLNMEARAGQQQALSRPRQTILQVITGTGNHSRGQAALPTAIRSFLIENRYRFDDVRPGVFTVWPKFRH